MAPRRATPHPRSAQTPADRARQAVAAAPVQVHGLLPRMEPNDVTQLVAVGSLAQKHPAVGEGLQPTAQWLEDHGGDDGQHHRQLDRQLIAQREPRGSPSERHVDHGDDDHQHAVHRRARAQCDVDVEHPVAQDADRDADRNGQEERKVEGLDDAYGREFGSAPSVLSTIDATSIGIAATMMYVSNRMRRLCSAGAVRKRQNSSPVATMPTKIGCSEDQEDRAQRLQERNEKRARQRCRCVRNRVRDIGVHRDRERWSAATAGAARATPTRRRRRIAATAVRHRHRDTWRRAAPP